MEKILVKTNTVGGMEIDGYPVTCQTKTIRAELDLIHEANTEFYLPDTYTYELIESNFWGKYVAKIVYTQNKNNMYNVTCLVTGKSDNLRMHAMRSEKGEMIGWVFLHESLSLEDIETEVSWKHKISAGNIAITKTGLKSTN